MSFMAMVGEIWPILWWVSTGVRELILMLYMPHGVWGIWPMMESFLSWIVHELPLKVVVYLYWSSHLKDTSVYPTSGEKSTLVRYSFDVFIPFGTLMHIFPSQWL